jgi:cytochrome c oxidase accessory protein FixG
MNEMIPVTHIAEPEDQDPSAVQYRSLYDGKKVYTRKVEGYYQNLRRITGLPLLLAYFLTPWLRIDGRPAVLFDMSDLKFHVLWGTFWPQDSILLIGVLSIAAFALFTVTVWAGRLWCGFSCPQTLWTSMFIWIEDKCEGDRNQRIKLDQAPWSRGKVLKKFNKHSLWLALSVFTAFTFVAYFYEAKVFLQDLLSLSVSLEGFIWLALFTFFTYLNAGYLREQVCKHMCPYSRFQSAMYDSNTLLVTYDTARGENRGPRKPGSDYRKQGLGDCIDCNWCVQVCPADIDIRNGLQAECIDCGLCIDACDSVMDKLGYEQGLIKFSSESGERSSLKRFLQPKMLGYSAALILMILTFSYSISDRIPLQVDVIRDRGAHLFRDRGGYIENVYIVKLNNMQDRADTISVSVRGDQAYEIRGNTRVYLQPGEVFTVPLRLLVKKDVLSTSRGTVFFMAQSNSTQKISAQQKTVFLGPSSSQTR